MNTGGRELGSDRGFVCQSPEVASAVEALVARCADQAPPDGSPASVVATFGALYGCTWEELALIFGRRGSLLIFDRARDLQVAAAPDLRLVELGEDGVGLAGLAVPGAQALTDDLREDLTGLLLAVFDVLCNMIGPDLTGQILRRIAQSAEGRGQQRD